MSAIQNSTFTFQEEEIETWLPYLAQVEGAYLLTNGEFALDNIEKYDKFGWFIFFLATIFNLIIMLNLLLSIIAETFGRVIQKSHETMF